MSTACATLVEHTHRSYRENRRRAGSVLDVWRRLGLNIVPTDENPPPPPRPLQQHSIIMAKRQKTTMTVSSDDDADYSSGDEAVAYAMQACTADAFALAQLNALPEGLGAQLAAADPEALDVCAPFVIRACQAA